MSINISVSNLLTQLNSTGAYSYSTTTEKRTLNETKLSAKDNCSLFAKSLRSLRSIKIESASGKTAAKKHINNIVKSFNSLTEEAKTINSKALNRRLEKLNSLFDEYTEDLEDLGIKKDSKGNLTFDKTKIDSLEDTKTFSKIFGKDSDFSKNLEKYAKTIKSNVSQNIIQVTNVTSRTTVSIENDKISMANSANMFSTYINSLAGASDNSSALTYMQEIMNNFNLIFAKSDGSEADLLDKLFGTVKNNSDALNEIGIQINEEDKSLSFSSTDPDLNGENTFTDNYEKAVSLFGGSFGEELNSISEDLFCALLETSKNDITIDQYV